MRVISLFRSINKKINNILSFEKDLLHLEKDERMFSHSLIVHVPNHQWDVRIQILITCMQFDT